MFVVNVKCDICEFIAAVDVFSLDEREVNRTLSNCDWIIERDDNDNIKHICTACGLEREEK